MRAPTWAQAGLSDPIRNGQRATEMEDRMTLGELRALWYERDARYAVRSRLHRFLPLSPAEAAAIRWHRETEVDALPRPVQATARAELARWEPPSGRWRVVLYE
jgi:hypothetical protein